MAFTDALFDGPVVLEGVTCRRIEQLVRLAEASGGSGSYSPRGWWIPATTLPLEDVVDSLRPAVLVDARMRKRAVPEPQRHLAPLTIGLGPNFVAGETTDLVVETSWGERLGNHPHGGVAGTPGGEPAPTAVTHGPLRVRPGAGDVPHDRSIGERVRAGQVVATLDGAASPPARRHPARLTHDGVVVEQGPSDRGRPRGDIRHVTGIGERPGAIGDAVVRAIRASRSVRVPGTNGERARRHPGGWWRAGATRSHRGWWRPVVNMTEGGDLGSGIPPGGFGASGSNL